ncbi:MAG: UDP-N-acetylmuramate dehydrogenase, partial [Burkholderiales bacterium]|nr:UDP-N-acetylmuramate dehydrogenase [Burkholderiales bacterium]
MLVENQVPLQPFNTFGIQARAHTFVRIGSVATLLALHRAHPSWLRSQPLVLGGGSNLVLTGDVTQAVLKVDIMGRELVSETPHHWVVQAGAGENWHGFVDWTLAQGWPGLENLALVPGTVGASPVQNIGAYGVELQDRFHSLDAVDLHTGQQFSLDAAQCGFGYRDSVFKHAPGNARHLGLAGRALITHVRFALPKKWVPELSYLDLARKAEDTGTAHPSARQVFDWVCDIRRAKLPDPAVVGNA